MRKLIVFNSVTLDGYFSGENGDISWAHENSHARCATNRLRERETAPAVLHLRHGRLERAKTVRLAVSEGEVLSHIRYPV
jgi:hypothetical protein